MRSLLIDGIEPGVVSEPGSLEALTAELARARSDRLTVLPLGLATRLGGGRPQPRIDLALVTTGLSRVLHYEPNDLTVTVEAGMRIEQLRDLLAEARQFLPLESRRGQGTVGGLLATAPEGARALGYGAPRDWLTGMRAALADGSLVRGGGRVVKNVAGYPIHRLMIGSFGTLGVMVEASFKVHPKPESEASALVSFTSESSAFEAARRVLDSGTEPVFVNVLIGGGSNVIPAAPVDPILLAVGYDGFASRVDSHVKALEDIVGAAHPEGMRVLRDLENQRLRDELDDPAGEPLPFQDEGSGPRPLLRADEHDGPGSGISADSRSVTEDGRDDAQSRVRRPSAHGSMELGGTIPCDGSLETAAAHVRCVLRMTALPSRLESQVLSAHAVAREAGAEARLDARPGMGSAYLSIVTRDAERARAALEAALVSARAMGQAVIVRAPHQLRSVIDPWGAPPGDLFLMKRIKEALDPTGLFVEGRFVGGL